MDTKSLFRKSFALLTLVSIGSMASINIAHAQTATASPETAKTSAKEMMSGMAGAAGMGMMGMMGGSAMMIVNLGNLAWNVIEANKASENVNASSANALPASAKSWEELAGWQIPVVQEYEKDYHDMFGLKAVKIKYRVHYTYGGSLNGNGLYLTDISVEPSDISVDFGYTVSMTASVPNVVNMGTAENPIAAAELLLDIKVSTLFSSDDVSMNYFVKGDGSIQEIKAKK